MHDDVRARCDRAMNLGEAGDEEGAVSLLRDALLALDAEIETSRERWRGFEGVYDAAVLANDEYRARLRDQAALQLALGRLLQQDGRSWPARP